MVESPRLEPGSSRGIVNQQRGLGVRRYRLRLPHPAVFRQRRRGQARRPRPQAATWAPKNGCRRLPQEDAEVLIEERRVRFLLATRNQAIHLPAGDCYLLAIQSSFFNWSHSERVYVVCHEMAHAFLEHKATSAKAEFLADRRVVRWGFEDELESVPNSYLRGFGMEQRFGVTRTGIIKE